MVPGFSLAVAIALKEMRVGVSGFRIFIACLALGVAAIAGVGSLSEGITGGIEKDARRLLGGDVAFRLLHRPATDPQRAYLNNLAVVSEVVEMRAMAQVDSGVNPGVERRRGRTLVELKAVDDLYPLVGRLELFSGAALRGSLARKDESWGAVAEQNLLTKLGLKIGDSLRVGEASFVITGIIAKEPDRVATVLGFGPRLMVSSQSLAATELVQPGSQIRYRYRAELPDGVVPNDWIDQVKAAFPTAGWRIRALDQAAPGLQRFIDRITLFLSFVGLTTLLVGGVGVSNAVESYLDGKVRTIATLKCLGAPGALIFRTYFFQILVLAGGGILIGLIAGGVLPAVGAWALKGQLPVDIQVGIFPMSLIIAAVFGFLIAFTFALWPLARARSVPAASLFRDKITPGKHRPGWVYVLLVVMGGVGLSVLTIMTATDRWFAFWFVVGALASLALLRVSAAALTRLARRIHASRWTELRLAVANLHRPGASTNPVVLSLGLGLTVLVAISLIESNLSRQVDERLPEMAPAFFFIDIQPHQIAAFDKTLAGFDGTGVYRRVASLRGRIVKIAGQPVDEVTIAAGSQWAVRGDRALTYAVAPSEGTRIVAGDWWPADYSGPPLISLDAQIAKDFGVGVGDTLTLNILGREMEAEIGSLRAIDWRSIRFDFAIIFAPGTLENAPHSHIAALQAPEPMEDSIENAVASQFNNISIIRVREALQSASNILAGIGVAVRATAVVTIIGGILVLAGAIAAGRRRRVYDAVVFKVLGATRATVLRAFLLEYGLLGVATGVIAALIGSLTAWAVVVLLMDMTWYFHAAAVFGTIVLCLVATLAIGFAGTWRALGQKAAPLLRNK